MTKILPLLEDPSLLVRLKAVPAIEQLKPVGFQEALAKAVSDTRNFRGGKAQWVPYRALTALENTSAPKSVLPLMAPALSQNSDLKFQTQLIQTLEKLSGSSLKAGQPLAEKVTAWKDYFKNTKPNRSS